MITPIFGAIGTTIGQLLLAVCIVAIGFETVAAQPTRNYPTPHIKTLWTSTTNTCRKGIREMADAVAVRIFDEKTKDAIKEHEGFRSKAYQCSEGHWTVGWGHKIDEHTEVCDSCVNRWFLEDYMQARDIAEQLLVEFNCLHLSPARKSIIINMAFNLGYPRLRKFKKMWAALTTEDYETAAAEMQDSQWFNQVKGRARELIKCMKQNTFPKGDYL